MVADSSCTKVVRFREAWQCGNQLQDLFLNSIRQRLFQQIANASAQQADRYLDDEDAHHNRSDGIQYGPSLPQEDGTTNTYSRTNGRKGVAAMMPRICLNGR